jgi:hypothetical protein
MRLCRAALSFFLPAKWQGLPGIVAEHAFPYLFGPRRVFACAFLKPPKFIRASLTS